MTTESPFNCGMSMTPADSCYRCGYNLTGIADDQPCPECGLLAARSRRSSDELHQTRPRWLRKLSLGIWLMLLAGVLPVVLYLVLGLILFATQTSRGSIDQASLQLLLTLPLDVSGLLICIGVFLLGTAEQYPPADRADRTLRIFLRFAGAAPLIALLFLQVDLMSDASRGWTFSVHESGFSALELVTLIVATVGTAPLPILIGLRLRGLAKRAHSAHLAEHCIIVGVGVSLTLAYVLFYSLIEEYSPQWGLGLNFTGGKVWLMFSLTLWVLSFLMLIWNLYLLIRFAVAFGSAARALRNEWRRDDRSLVPIGVS